MAFAKELRDKLAQERNPSFSDADKTAFVKLCNRLVKNLDEYAYINLADERDLYLSLSTPEGLQYLVDEGFYVNNQEKNLLLVYWVHESLEPKPEPIPVPEPVVDPVVDPIEDGGETPVPPDPIDPEAPVVDETPVPDPVLEPVPEENPAPIEEPVIDEVPTEDPSFPSDEVQENPQSPEEPVLDDTPVITEDPLFPDQEADPFPGQEEAPFPNQTPADPVISESKRKKGKK